MQEQLLEKMKFNSQNYNLDEIKWLINNRGHPNSEIRDKLIYRTFVRGMAKELFSIDQVRYMIDQLLEKDFILFEIDKKGEATLKRSFSLLLLSLIVTYDNEKGSIYYKLLDKEAFKKIENDTLTYFYKELDFSGYADCFGWVHTFAHAADLMVAIVKHPLFNKTNLEAIWKAIMNYFRKIEIKPVDDEEDRLVYIIKELFVHNILHEDKFKVWINRENFPRRNNKEYYQWSAFRSFCMAIYIELDQLGLASDDLKKRLYDPINR
ncbi:DUF2785 domain-containing protein [Facklamia sp. P12945]|uniref:DUF2785 domain-containing protein n=1 Tax=unclassified Facklamia TaxID=2622293 RepID=UPI003D1835F2